jgi:hypothetical protein
MAGLGLELKLKPPHTLKNCFVVRFEAAKSLASKSTPLLEEICQKKTKEAKIKKKVKGQVVHKLEEIWPSREPMHANQYSQAPFKSNNCLGWPLGIRGPVA